MKSNSFACVRKERITCDSVQLVTASGREQSGPVPAFGVAASGSPLCWPPGHCCQPASEQTAPAKGLQRRPTMRTENNKVLFILLALSQARKLLCSRRSNVTVAIALWFVPYAAAYSHKCTTTICSSCSMSHVHRSLYIGVNDPANLCSTCSTFHHYCSLCHTLLSAASMPPWYIAAHGSCSMPQQHCNLGMKGLMRHPLE